MYGWWRSFYNLLVAVLSSWQCPLHYRNFAILWGALQWFLILEHKKFSPVPTCSRLFPTFFSISSSVSGFMWRSLLHLDFSFAQQDKNGSICILLLADLQLNQNYLLKMFVFPLDGFGFFVKDQVTIHVCFHFWVFNSVSLIFLDATVLIPCCFDNYFSVRQLDVRDDDFPWSSFIVENNFCYPGVLLFQMNLQINLILWRIELEF